MLVRSSPLAISFAVVESFDPRSYWEQRLFDDWSLRGVGFSHLGVRFNQLAYRRRGERFAALVNDVLPDRSGLRVLDVGSGTGFYLEAWRQLGAKEIVGLDLTDAAVERLRERFPDLEIRRGDIGDDAGSEPQSVDVVSAMDVMFHIVDPDRFSASLNSIANILTDGGLFIWSDQFLHGPEVVEQHVAFRSLYRIEAMLDHAGFDVVTRRPMFFFMDEPRDTSSTLIWNSWRVAMRLAATSETLGGLFGSAAYWLDVKLDGRTESPSTEMMVCKKRPA